MHLKYVYVYKEHFFIILCKYTLKLCNFCLEIALFPSQLSRSYPHAW